MINFKFTTQIWPDNGYIVANDISSWDSDREKYFVAMFYEYESTKYQILNLPMEDRWYIPNIGIGEYNVIGYAVRMWLAQGYDQFDMVMYPEVVGNTVNLKLYTAKNSAALSTDIPGVSAVWVEVNFDDTAANNYTLFSAAENILTYSRVEVISSPDLVMTKSDLRTFKFTKNSSFEYTLSLYKFVDYINSGEPYSTDYTFTDNQTFVVVPEDGLYVVVAEVTAAPGSYQYFVIYAFDGMRDIIKELIKKVLCPQNVDCEKEQLNIVKADRLFITKVSTSFFLIIGIMHSEQVNHFNYFGMNESRLAALQRVNDIFAKIVVLFSDYDYDLTCNCHS